VSATLAHSSRDSEPWHLVTDRDDLQLHADPGRWMLSVDPMGRTATRAVGCALLNARASLDTEPFTYQVLRCPDPKRPLHLATLCVVGPRPTFQGSGPDGGLAHLAKTGFDRYAVDPTRVRVPRPDEVELLAAAAAAEGAHLRQLEPDLVVVTSAQDGVVDWLTAGEAVQRLILEAALLGLGVEEVDSSLDSAADRGSLRHQLGGTDHPQAVLRLGSRGQLVRGRRRPLADVLRT
jgi:hypothetical protein